jgi:hypothetical protein
MDKTRFLLMFEAAVAVLVCGNSQRLTLGQRLGSLYEGLWVNAHMWHGIGLDVELAACKYVTDVIATYHPHLIADENLAKYLHRG